MRAINWSGVRSWLPSPDSGERVLATLLFTDIVGSTAMVERIGDAAWRELLARHDRQVRDILDRFRGREVNTTGDGFLAVFDGAGRAIRAAVAIRERTRALGLEIRAGINTGEVELVGADVRGIVVHEASRLASGAAPGQIIVSATTRQLAAGTEFAFDDLGMRELKGLSGERALYAVAG
jgi:class 3 adenylate cyclase